MILAGDIGGMHTRLAFFTVASDHLTAVVEETFPSRAHGGLTEIAAPFLAVHQLLPATACFGIAGPVKNGRCEATNLPWVVGASELARTLRIPTVFVINDLEANAYGIAALAPTDFLALNAGASEATEELRAQDPAAVITHAALTGRSAVCDQALDLFVSLYGAEAGNLALKVVAIGGVFIGGASALVCGHLLFGTRL